jgi:ADP-ribosylglycohydrolase
MLGYGTHNQPEGTWSDDSSLTFCLAESLSCGYNLQDIANRFVDWYENAYWTPHGNVFDVGIATSQAIHSLSKAVPPTLAGGRDEDSNGNGSLMRILPLVFYVQNLPIERRYQIIKDVSSLTHAHIRSVLACFIYVEMALELLSGKGALESYQKTKKKVNDFTYQQPICSQNEIDIFHRVLGVHSNHNYEIRPIYDYTESEIIASGYVVHSLEASFWCLLNSNSYQETVLKAVNLGKDTDTTGAIAGGLAGLLYGFDNMPIEWVGELAKRKEIEDLSERFFIQSSLKY